LPNISAEDKICFIGHSLAPVFILHLVNKYKINVDCAIFVSPFLDDIGGEFWQFKVVNGIFYEHSFDYAELKQLLPTSYVIFGSKDPYVDRKFPIDIAKKMNSSIIEVKNGVHSGTISGDKEFPLLLELCKTRVS
jgi:predicted alpha/beta hydrolase family esterase